MICKRCKAPTDKVATSHCDGQPGNKEDRWRCPEPGSCHIACVCNSCDFQWVERCQAHQIAA